MKLKVTIDGKTYEVDVEAAEPEQPGRRRRAGSRWSPRRCACPRPAPPPACRPSGTPVDEAKVCRSPVSGIVVRIAAQVGQTLQTGDVLSSSRP